MARVLVIEDDRAIALGLRLNLRKDGHDVALAQDGEQGLAMALEAGVDLVVLDVMLPARNGDELIKTLDNFVRSPRVKLEEDAEAPRHFLTVRGHGYRFER